MKRIILSLGMIVFVGAIVIGATGAFFSDSEVSTGNILAAGAIDLGIDNHSYYNGLLNASTTWRIDYDIDDTEFPGDNPATQVVETGYSLPIPRQFFNFTDLKPGDWGEDTISIHVNNNDSWLCADVTLTSDNDNGLTEPEGDDGDTSTTTGELADAVDFFWWADDGDNVFETCQGTDVPLCVSEELLPAGPMGVLDVGETATVALADSDENIWENATGTPLTGDSVRFLAKAWCFGDSTMTPYPQDGGNQQSGPDDRPVLCDGEGENNITQTDSFTANIGFRAVQSRNNADFQCEAPDGEPEPERELVGANLTDYVAPTTCNVTVDDTGSDPALDTIQEGVDAAIAGQTVCVKAGTYTQDVNVNKSLTLIGDGSAITSLTGVGTGFGGALTVAAGIDNVTIEGFTVNGTGESAVYLTSNNDNVDVLYNRIVAATAKNALLTGGQQTNSTLANNVFEGNGSQLVYVNGSASLGVVNASTNVDFTSNTFGGTATGPLLGLEANGSSVTLNKFSGTTSYTSFESWEGNNLVNQNNFNVDLAVGPMHVVNGVVPINTQFPGILNAQNNWWGDTDPSDNTTGLVDSSSPEATAFPQN